MSKVSLKAAASAVDAEVISVPELAARLAISVRTVWRLIRQNDIQAMRVGKRRTVLSKSEVERFIAATKKVAPRKVSPHNRAPAKTAAIDSVIMAERKIQQILVSLEASTGHRVESLEFGIAPRGGKPAIWITIGAQR